MTSDELHTVFETNLSSSLLDHLEDSIELLCVRMVIHLSGFKNGTWNASRTPSWGWSDFNDEHSLCPVSVFAGPSGAIKKE
jgi:hypothetical protein